MTAAEQIAEVLRALNFVGEFGFEWFGKRPAELRPALRRRLDRQTRIRHRDATLCKTLYEHFYRHGYARPIRWDMDQSPPRDGTFLHSLIRANAGRGWVDDGWQVTSLSPPRATLRKSGLTITAFLDELEPRDDNPVGEGALVGLRRPSQLAGLSPGYFTVASDRQFDGTGAGLLRYYWNVPAGAAVHLLTRLTGDLNAAGIGFRLKVANFPSGHDRCDSAVLYAARVDHDRLAGLLEPVHAALFAELAPTVPVFCKPLAPGLGLAENPPDDQSFGLSRCQVLADGLLAAQRRGETGPPARMRRIAEAFGARGISLDTPYLNPGSRDNYRAFKIETPRRAATRAARPMSRPALLDAAGRVAGLLCDSAIRQGDRCTWIVPNPGDASAAVAATLGADLYSGLSGVALFLVEFARLSGCSTAAATARAALSQAEHRRADIPPGQRAGLFSGWTGIALATRRAGVALNDPGLCARADHLAAASAEAVRVCDETDLISGQAGAILGLLDLSHALEDADLLATATQAGDRLLAAAERSGSALSWRTINKAREHRLTGMSHGGAGIAFALFRLARATGETRFSDAARSALHYEQQWFDPAHGNWPDLREARLTRKHRQGARSFSTYWCHGAPGIALSRLEAFRATGERSYLAQADHALATTVRDVASRGLTGLHDAILCHGLVGNADILLTAARFDVETCVGRDQDVAQAVARAVAETIPRDGAQVVPGLMTGLAGAGWFLLRLLDPEVPSVLNGCTADRPGAPGLKPPVRIAAEHP